MKSPMFIRGMLGLGDNLHQRAVIRILKEKHSVTLETMWASLYHDLIDDDFRIIRRNAALRTQLKNAAREAHLFSPAEGITPTHVQRISYNTSTIEHVTKSKTVLEAMFYSAGIQARYADADFRLPLKPIWLEAADDLIRTWGATKPIMIYRPLTSRPEWGGGSLRNADPTAYSEMAAMVRDKFFVVSVADLAPGAEWIVGPPFGADICYHAGELQFELLAAIFKRASLVLTSGGFASVLAPAVGTPCISVLGGYEPASWCGDGAKWAPYLAIEPIKPCRCGTSGCRNRCTKEVDIPHAKAAVRGFVYCLPPLAAPNVNRIAPMLDLKNVTLVSVETQTHNLAEIAINDAVSKANFGGVLIYTDKPDLIKVPGAEYRVVPDWPDKIKMGEFYYNEAAAPITTSHALLMEWDAGIRDVKAWDESFLDYDYIGAPWPGPPWGWDPRGMSTVGNGGFALVSKRLAAYVFEHRATLGINTDLGIARNNRQRFENAFGAKWAPEDVAYRFSFECGSPEQAVSPSFGYHDVFNWHLALPNEETIRRTRLLMANEYISTGTPKLHLLYKSAPWIASAIPEFMAAVAKYKRVPPAAKHLTGRQMIRMIQPGVGIVERPAMHDNPAEARRLYERDLQRRGLKA